jgi:hypothetical protein
VAPSALELVPWLAVKDTVEVALCSVQALVQVLALEFTLWMPER